MYQWSRVGRLKRAKFPSLKGGGHTFGGGAGAGALACTAGRLLCDTYLSARCAALPCNGVQSSRAQASPSGSTRPAAVPVQSAGTHETRTPADFLLRPSACRLQDNQSHQALQRGLTFCRSYARELTKAVEYTLASECLTEASPAAILNVLPFLLLGS